MTGAVVTRMTQFLLDTRRTGSTMVVVVSGDMDQATAPVLSIIASAALADPDITSLRLEFSDVPFLDPSAVTVLRQVNDCAERRGKAVTVGDLQPRARETMEDAGLSWMLGEAGG